MSYVQGLYVIKTRTWPLELSFSLGFACFRHTGVLTAEKNKWNFSNGFYFSSNKSQRSHNDQHVQSEEILNMLILLQKTEDEPERRHNIGKTYLAPITWKYSFQANKHPNFTLAASSE